VSDTSHDSTAPDDTAVRLTVWLAGVVQGVGMRWWVRSRALELGLVGSASNRLDGRVEVVAEGSRVAVEALLAQLAPGAGFSTSGRPGEVTGAVEQWDVARGGIEGFRER
jgi:acylphosphatase